MLSQEIKEIEDEIDYLEDKKSQRGWNRRDKERYDYLISQLSKKE